ncbi:unnamed protein product [Lupinus luteus]|uniref:Uncharacterized protein n=1 Tax=Lupinus luteus TaxID=3873 RepID=A0AAV1XTX1_LUPLU
MDSQQCPLHFHINTLHCPLHPHRHHHHHHHHHRHCPLHHRHHSHCKFQSHLLPTPSPLPPTPPTSAVVHHHQPNPQISEELEHIELDDEELDDDPVFVLTDEWREFFAKSEAKRKLGFEHLTFWSIWGSTGTLYH